MLSYLLHCRPAPVAHDMQGAYASTEERWDLGIWEAEAMDFCFVAGC